MFCLRRKQGMEYNRWKGKSLTVFERYKTNLFYTSTDMWMRWYK